MPSGESAWAFVDYHLGQLPIPELIDGKLEVLAERQDYLLYDRMVAFHIQRGLPVPLSAAEFYAGLRERYPSGTACSSSPAGGGVRPAAAAGRGRRPAPPHRHRRADRHPLSRGRNCRNAPHAGRTPAPLHAGGAAGLGGERGPPGTAGPPGGELPAGRGGALVRARPQPGPWTWRRCGRRRFCGSFAAMRRSGAR